MITGLSNVTKIIGDTDKNNDNEGKNLFGVFSRKKEGREIRGNYGQYFQRTLPQREAKKGVALVASVTPREIYFFNRGKDLWSKWVCSAIKKHCSLLLLFA